MTQTTSTPDVRAFIQSVKEGKGEKVSLAEISVVQALSTQFMQMIQGQIEAGAKSEEARMEAIGVIEALANTYAEIFSGQTATYVPAPHWNGKTVAEMLQAEGVDAFEALQDWFATDLAAQYIASTSNHTAGHMTDQQYQGFVDQLQGRMVHELLGPDYKD